MPYFATVKMVFSTGKLSLVGVGGELISEVTIPISEKVIKGDLIHVVAPAGKVNAFNVKSSINRLKQFGFNVSEGISLYKEAGSFAGDDEEELLKEFGEIFNRPKLQNVILCAHNGKEFDFPWIARRFLINGMQPPIPFQMFGKKPWEIPHLDTMELWKFGDWKSFISLELMAHLFGVPTPKDDIDGSMVSSIYYIEKDLPRIVKYCEKDVLTLANVFRKMRQEDLLERRED
mgnify:CR=1 FL=1